MVYLSQSDFLHGTYRIVRGGRYVVTEDIELDFNAPAEGASPNSEGAYMPLPTDAARYPGADAQSGPYFMGFFAGLTIEADGVELDLNGHEVAMSDALFAQQGFFSIIELGSQPFLPLHGPGNFGATPSWPSHITIRNGRLGRSSHHAIHGNNNRHVLVENVDIHSFVTHGIQLNGFENVTLRDIDIGPSHAQLRLNANYIQMRALLANLRALSSAFRSPFSFAQRGAEVMTLRELVEGRLVPAMDAAFRVAVFGDAVEEAAAAEGVEVEDVSCLLRPSAYGEPYGAVVYGLFLNYPASGIFGWHVSQSQSSGALLENVRVHDLSHRAEEVVGLTTNRHGVSHALNGPLSAISLLGEAMMREVAQVIATGEGSFTAAYAGDLVTDVHFAYYRAAYDDWDFFPGTPYYGDDGELAAWAFGDEGSGEVVSSAAMRREELEALVTCNGDRMQHPLKGVVGIKVTGVADVVLRGRIEVSALRDASDLGSTLCGAYDKANFGQQPPFSLGYSGNMVHALDVAFSDVRVETSSLVITGVTSETGLAYALSLWYATRLEFAQGAASGVLIDGVYAGSRYAHETQTELAQRYTPGGPNHRPQACALRVHDSDEFVAQIVFEGEADEQALRLRCVRGVEGCEEGADLWTHVGTVDNSGCAEEPRERQRQSVSYLAHVAGAGLLTASCVTLIAVCHSACQGRERRWQKAVIYGSFN